MLKPLYLTLGVVTVFALIFSPTCPKAKFRKNIYLVKEIKTQNNLNTTKGFIKTTLNITKQKNGFN
jgi:hypothetical protein